ncbi:hypothetical protein [Caudoviricetes sp.]|nr:hypothetical protein [Caudoviricetes sp.]
MGQLSALPSREDSNILIWDDARTTSQRLAQDTSTDGVAFLDLMMNVGYKEVLEVFGTQLTEKQMRTTLVVSQRNYQVPPDLIRPTQLKLIDGTTITPIIEEPSEQRWSLRTSGNIKGKSSMWHYRPRFGVGGGLLQLDPIPSSTYTLELTYEATERDLSQTKYTTGTISLTNGSATVTGSSTVWTADMVGRYLRLTGNKGQRVPYRIQSFGSTTSVQLEQKYHGATDTGLAYEIFEMFALPEDAHVLPVFYALWQWWDSKGNVGRAGRYESMYNSGIERLKDKHANLTTDLNVPIGSISGFGFGEASPFYFPESIS